MANLSLEQWNRRPSTRPSAPEVLKALGCDNYRRPKGVMGGPCLNCGASQPEHVNREPICPQCGWPARLQLIGGYVCDRCHRGV